MLGKVSTSNFWTPGQVSSQKALDVSVRSSDTEVAHHGTLEPQFVHLVKILPLALKGNTQDSSVEPSQEAVPGLGLVEY